MKPKLILKYFLFILAFVGPIQMAVNSVDSLGMWHLLWFVVSLVMIGYASSISVNKN